MKSPHCGPNGFSPPVPPELQAQLCQENPVTHQVPEPQSIGLVGLAVIIMMYVLRRKHG